MSKPTNEPTVKPTKQTKSKRGKYSLSEKQDAELPSKITVSTTQFTSDSSIQEMEENMYPEGAHHVTDAHNKYIVSNRVRFSDKWDSEIQSMRLDESLP